MRFRVKEFRAFVAAIEKAGLQQSDFDFVKKRGWLSIIQKESKRTFRYHRKKETTLNENGQWKDEYEFCIQIEKSEKELKENEDEVVKVFESWLRTKA